MAGSQKSVSAGFQQLWLGFLDSNGFLLGSTPTAPAAGAAGSGMMRVSGAKTAQITTPERELVQVSGDDGLIAEFDFDPLTSRGFAVELAIQDLLRDGRLNGTPVESIAGGLMGYLDILDAAEYDVCMLLQSRSKKQDAGVVGRKAWSGYYMPLGTAQPLGRGGFDERGAATYRLNITPQRASRNAWGVTMLDDSALDINAFFRPFSFDYPITLHRWTANGVLTTFNLDVTPVDTTSLAVYSSVGAAQTVNSVSVASKTLTLNSAPANNLGLVGMVQYQP